MRPVIAATRLLAVLVLAVIVIPAYQGPQVRSQLEWVDRTGKQLSILGSVADYGTIELSPDGTQVAVALMDPVRGSRDVWLYAVDTDRRTRLLSTPEDENWQIWSPNGQEIIFNRFGSQSLGLYRKQSNGDGGEDRVLLDDIAKWPVSWSPDGRYILYVINSPITGNDVWVLPLFGDRRPFPILQTGFQENWASFSPDGQSIAFSSTESGRPEVYVTSFPTPAGKKRISDAGGIQARWRRDGKEIFYIGERGALTAVTLKGDGAGFEIGAPASLFDVHIPRLNYRAYDVAADGQRFLMNTLVSKSDGPVKIAQLDGR